MSGRISDEGLLYLTRRGKDTQQLCPFGSSGNPCGDHCPHFGDATGNRVTICHNNTLLGVVDERKEYIKERKHTASDFVKVDKATTEEVISRKGGARTGAGRRKKYWTVLGKGLLSCPDCGSESTALNEPTHCPHCRVRLHLPE